MILDQQQTEGGTEWGTGETGAQKTAQTFKPSVSADICNFAVYLYKGGSPTDDFKLQVYTDNAGVPGILLGESTTIINGASLTTSSQLTNFSFDRGIQLTVNETYWAVLFRTGAPDDTNFYKLEARLSSLDNKYNRGSTYDYNGSAWVNYDDATHFYDLHFQEYYFSPLAVVSSVPSTSFRIIDQITAY